MTTQPLVELDRIAVTYGDRVALDDVSLTLYAGEVIAFVGPNGAGKSTLLKTIAGQVRPDRGTVTFSPTLGQRPRQEVIYVPQRDKLDWSLPASVLDLVLMGCYRETSRWRPLRRESTDAALRALDTVGMRHHAGTQIGRLSGGQQQRVALARALIRPATIYLLDEPFTGVDAPTEALFEEVIMSLRAEGKCVVMATHNLSCARDTSDRILVLNKRVVALGPSAEALTPLTIAVAFGDIARLHIHGEDAHVHE